MRRPERPSHGRGQMREPTAAVKLAGERRWVNQAQQALRPRDNRAARSRRSPCRRPAASRTPHRHIQPTRRAGTPTISAKAGTSLRDHGPGADEAVFAQGRRRRRSVALAPIDAPRRTRVRWYSAFRETWLRGFTTLVKTQLGPAEDVVLQGHALVDRDVVLHLHVVAQPGAAGMTTTFWPRLQRSPITAPGMTWQKCQILVPCADLRRRHRCSWIRGRSSRACSPAQLLVQVFPPARPMSFTSGSSRTPNCSSTVPLRHARSSARTSAAVAPPVLTK